MNAAQQPHRPTGDESAQSRAALVLAVGVSCAFHVGKLPVAIPHLRQELGLDILEAGFLLSLLQLAGMFLGLLAGLLADRHGPRQVMLAGLMLLALGSAAGSLAPTVGWLLATRVVEGMGFLLAVLPAPALLRLQVPQASALSKALGWWGAYMPLGTALALLLGAPLLTAMGWRWVWALLALISGAMALLLIWKVPAPDGVAPGPQTALGPRLRRTLAAPGPWLLAVGFFLYSGQWLAVIGFLPTISAEAGVDGAWIGWLGAAAAAINIVGNVAAGRWLARGATPGKVLTVAYLAMGAGAVVAFAAQGHPVAQYLGVLCFSGMGGLIPGTLFGLAVQMAPDKDTVSTTVGWMQQFSSLGQFAGPPAAAWLATQVGGWQWTWALTGACSLLGVVVARVLQRVWRARMPVASRKA